MPPKRKAKQIVKLTEEENRDEGIQREDDQEAERQIAAIKAIRDVEIEQSVTALRLLCSYYAEEHLQTPVLEFFKENLPSISFDEENGEILLKWNDKCGADFNYSILKSMGFPPDLYTSDGYEFPYNVRATLLGTHHNTHLQNLVLQETSKNRMLTSYDALRTPEVNGQRLSFGVTPKTRRQPKPGEMMLSVHGSPLGVYEEDQTMGALNEENS